MKNSFKVVPKHDRPLPLIYSGIRQYTIVQSFINRKEKQQDSLAAIRWIEERYSDENINQSNQKNGKY